MSSRNNRERKVYIGNLTEDASKQEVENVLSKYGKLKNVWIARKPPGFAFADFEDSRDAAYAVRELDGTRICGVRVRVELSHGKTTKKPKERSRRSNKESSRRNHHHQRKRYRHRSRTRSRSTSSRSSRSYSRSRSHSRDRSKRYYSRSRSR